jgi:hypothetical protein
MNHVVGHALVLLDDHKSTCYQGGNRKISSLSNFCQRWQILDYYEHATQGKKTVLSLRGMLTGVARSPALDRGGSSSIATSTLPRERARGISSLSFSPRWQLVEYQQAR